jgi:tetratricopeptide (TPR) repeat protein
MERFESECPDSPLAGRVLLLKAMIQETGSNTKEAALTLESLLSKRQVSGEFKAEALVRLGELHMKKERPRQAIPYYQRVCVMYSRWKTPLAKAYLRSGEAFEKIGDRTAARRTYQELLAAGLPRDIPEVTLAEKRLSTLGSNE